VEFLLLADVGAEADLLGVVFSLIQDSSTEASGPPE
jgi:hypothetical protein